MGKEPKILTRLKGQIRAQGKSKEDASRIAIAALQKSGNLKKGSTEATPKGIKRGEMGAAGRAKDRASRYGGGKHKPSAYTYSKKTNRATLGKD
jgi:hypothetical protein